MSERREQRAAEQLQRVADRWTTTGKADAVKANEGHQQAAPTPDAALAHPKVTAINIWAHITRVDGECWPWTGYVNKRGYGRFGGAQILAHRAAWEMVNGPIPVGHVIRHTCDNKICCNPDHLLPGTHADNVADMCSRGRNAMGEKNGRRKLSEEDVRKIRDMYIPRVVTRKKLSGLFGITESMIEKIVRRVYWKHLA